LRLLRRVRAGQMRTDWIPLRSAIEVRDETTCRERSCAPSAGTQGKKESAARDVFTAGFKPRPSSRDEHETRSEARGEKKQRPHPFKKAERVRHPQIAMRGSNEFRCESSVHRP
jgi:hypothetical protein